MQIYRIGDSRHLVAALEWNVVINPLHPNANQFLVSPSQKVIWNQRLFTRRSV